MVSNLRAMDRSDWADVAKLIHSSTNGWYLAHGHGPAFDCDPGELELYCRVYEALDPGCCVVAEDPRDGRLAGSCFYHPRPTHVGLGILNVDPKSFGQGIARQLVEFVIDRAGEAGLPLRLVSSAMNLDSFSLYNRLGFVPFAAYQDMVLPVPAQGSPWRPLGAERVRKAEAADVAAMVELERRVSGIERGQDLEFFLRDDEGIWHTSVIESPAGGLDGYLVSVASPATRMLGPGVMASAFSAMALIAAELDRHAGHAPVFLVPADCPVLTSTLYSWGARNCELHLGQVLGEAVAPAGIAMPSFLPETG